MMPEISGFRNSSF